MTMTREQAIKIIAGLTGTLEFTPTQEEAFSMAIEALQEVQKHEETFEWCHDCKEYDTENYCCHRWSKVIRNTVEELKEEPLPQYAEWKDAFDNLKVVKK